jgi:hypothetical protein
MVLGASVLLALTVPHRRHVSWIWQCHTSFNLPDGDLSASRTLNDDGQQGYDDDTFDWYGKDQLDAPLPMSIKWYGSRNEEAWRDGQVLAYLHGAGELPSNGRLLFRRAGGTDRSSPFEVGMSSSVGSRHTATASFRLNDLLAFAGESDTIDWTYENPMTPRKIDKSGRISVLPLRKALNARRAAEQELKSMQADYRDECQRVEYRPTIVY